MNNFIITSLELLKNGKDTLQLINIAFLTILIPVAIAIFDKRELDILDKNVIFYIIKAKYFLIYIALMFFPLFFWNISTSPIIYFIIFFVWGFGICFIIRILINSYYWLKGNKFSLRFDYLRKLKNLKDMEESWLSVWHAEKINSQNEQEFFKIFTYVIDNKLFKNKIIIHNTVSKLLNDFNNFIDNRSTFFLVVQEDVFTKILEWHFKVWKMEEKYLKKKNKSIRREYFQEIYYINILDYLDSIYRKIEERALKEKVNFYFFNYFKNHAEKYKKEFIAENKYYIEYLFNSFYSVFFKNIEDSLEKYYIWQKYFPHEWKITKTNLEDKENTISKESLHNFKEWARERILKAEKEFDINLHDVSINLFPEAEPIIWSKILIFAFTPCVEFVISLKWNFGLVGRFNVQRYNGEDIESDEENDINNTFELANLLFPRQFSKENLKKYIDDINKLKLKYEKESIEERKRLQLLNIFKSMLEFKH